jgi:cysteine desulfurase
MIYLDYSATTPVNKDVLETFNKVCLNYPGNANSIHKLGILSKELEQNATKQIANLLNVDPSSIIYTSGSSESNNLAIKGLIKAYPNRGKHIITTRLEHSSILEPLKELEKEGYKISYLKLNQDGTIDLDSLKELLKEDTILVTISSVSSELGILQPIEEIAKLLKNYPRCFFHVDATQSIGKVNVDFSNVNLVSFSAHKFFGLKGVGALIRNDVMLKPIIAGGDSTTIYRSGTPALPLIVSLSKALRLALENLDDKYNYVKNLNNDLTNYLSSFEGIHINSTNKSIPHILNFSISGIKPETMIHALEEHEIYLSTKSACSNSKKISVSVLELTNNKDYANSSIRISLSYLTKKEEIDIFKKVFKDCYDRLRLK